MGRGEGLQVLRAQQRLSGLEDSAPQGLGLGEGAPGLEDSTEPRGGGRFEMEKKVMIFLEKVKKTS